MKCRVKNCSNDTKNQQKDHGITFHMFPKDRWFRNIWKEVLGIENEPPNNSVVCSDHFRKEDVYITQRGHPRIRDGAFPVVVPVCRICLTTDIKMYSIRDRELQQVYADICGINMEEDKLKDKLPEKLCWECRARLLASARFRNRAITSHQLLTRLLHTIPYITLRDIKSINRRENDLRSNLEIHSHEPNECDMYIEEDALNKAEVDDVETKEKESFEEDNYLEEYLEEVSHAVEETNEINDDLHFEDEYLEVNTDAERNEHDGNDELLLKRKANVTDIDKCDDEKLNDLFGSDENVKETSRAKKRKFNLKVKPPKKKVTMKKRKQKSNAKEKSKLSHVKQSKPDGLDESMFTITSLTLEEQLEHARQRREEPRHKNALYSCAVCGLGFNDSGRFELHAAGHSELAGAYECVVCAKRQKTAKAMRQHLKSIHSRRYSCKQCPFVTQTRSMASHHQDKHEGAKYQCPHCSSQFINRSSYLGHLRCKHRANFICELCGFTFLSKRGVAIHKNILHRFLDEKTPLEGPHCDTCDVTFVSEEAHDRHLMFASQHSDENDPNNFLNDPRSDRDRWSQRDAGRRLGVQARAASDNEDTVTCEQCGEEFTGFRMYAQHFRFVHPEKTRTQFSGKHMTAMCEQCGRLFPNASVLRDHIMSHTGQELFQCNQCNRKFLQKSDLSEHIKITSHSGEITFECDQCDKVFSSKFMFMAHSKTHVEYACTICGKGFVHPSNRKRHMWTHTALKPFKCVACDKTFANPSLQKSHYKHKHLKKPWPKRKKDIPPEKRRRRVKAPVED